MRQEAHELHAALLRAKEPGPYILVGHSLGGLVVRIFAQRYPELAAGIALVDATSPPKILNKKELERDANARKSSGE